MARAGGSSDGGAGQHFVPASLLPYGGFGDPDTPAPYWKPSRSTDPHKVALSQAQDRFMRAVRVALLDSGISDDAFEQELGYRRYGLTRKLNGQELMTMRDVLRIAGRYPATLAALADTDVESIKLAEKRPVFRKTKDNSEAFHESLQIAIDALGDAADHLRDSGSARDIELEPAIRSLADVVNEIGRAVAGPKRKRKP